MTRTKRAITAVIEASNEVKIEEKVPLLNLEFFKDNKKVTLPADFVDRHDEGFVSGLKFILSRDDSLYETIISKDFVPFHKKSVGAHKDDHFYFEKLASGLVSQQISGKAALSIKNKLITTLGGVDGRWPPASKFSESSVESLRGCGLSGKKTEYIKGLAEAFLSGELSSNSLENLNEDDLYERLIKLKGIGPWSVVMFSMFSLHKLNSFNVKDLGIWRGGSNYLLKRPELLRELKDIGKFQDGRVMKKMKKLNSGNRKWVAVDEDLVEMLSEFFEPYKSVLMMVLWRLSDIHMEVLEK